MKKRTLLIALISLTYTIIHSQPISDVYGLLTPIQLTDTTTEVLLEDYFMDAHRIERVEVMDAFKADLSLNKKVLTLNTVKNAPIFSNMDIILRGGKRYSFLLKASQRQSVKLILKDDGYKKVAIKGDMNAWNPNDGVMKKIDNNWEITMRINAGNYDYKFVADGLEFKDPNCPTSSANGNNSLLIIPKPDAQKVSQLFTNTANNNQISIGFNNKPIKSFAYWDNHLILSDAHNWQQNSADNYTNNAFNLLIPVEVTFKKRSFIRIFSFNTEGVSNDILTPLENGKVVNSVAQLDSSDKKAQMMSFGLLDSFNKDDKKNRRMHLFKGWSKSERNTKKTAEKINFLRHNRLSLTYGDTEILQDNKDAFVLLKNYFGEVTISVFNKSGKAETVSFDLPERFKEKVLKGNFGGKVVKDGLKAHVQLAGTRFDILTD